MVRAGTNQKSVLVVDPDADARVIASAILRHRGYRPVAVPGLAAAVRRLRQSAVDIIVTELFAGRRHRHTLPSMLRRAAGAAVPILVVSGYVHPDYRAAARLAGAVRFLAKPVLPTDLATAVGQLAARRGPLTAGGGRR